jgi:hypothetical protein
MDILERVKRLKRVPHEVVVQGRRLPWRELLRLGVLLRLLGRLWLLGALLLQEVRGWEAELGWVRRVLEEGLVGLLAGRLLARGREEHGLVILLGSLGGV